jgi:5-methylthioadenosine/S-adenosylhomocysteine deaminase
LLYGTEKGKALRASYANHPRLNFSWAPHAPYSVSEPVWLKIHQMATDMKVPIHTHLHETKEEVEMSERGIDHFARHAAHMTQLNDKNIGVLAAAKANIVHCPSSNLKLISGLSPIHKCHTYVITLFPSQHTHVAFLPVSSSLTLVCVYVFYIFHQIK